MRTYTVSLNNGEELVLPLVDVDRGLAISLLMFNDCDFSTQDMIVDGLTEITRPLEVDAVLGVPDQGTVIANGVARRLGHPRCWILCKTTPKSFIDYFSVTYQSVTKGEQRLYMPKSWTNELSGKKVAVVEDVICTGGTIRAVVKLLDKVNQHLRQEKCDLIQLFGIRVILIETQQWEQALGPVKHHVRGLGYIPMFKPVGYTAIK